MKLDYYLEKSKKGYQKPQHKYLFRLPKSDGTYQYIYENSLKYSKLIHFIKESFNNPTNRVKKLIIGDIDKTAQQRIYEKTGLEAKKIIIDNYSVIHVLNKKSHNITIRDLLLREYIINNTIDIQLSNEKHQGNPVIIFKMDIEGEIVFLEEYRNKNNELELATAYRIKKSRRRSNAVAKSNPLELTSYNDPPLRNSIALFRIFDKRKIIPIVPILKKAKNYGKLIPVKIRRNDGKEVTYWVTPEEKEQQQIFDKKTEGGGNEKRGYFDKLDEDIEKHQIRPLTELFRKL
ncbi:MAG: hypothetical protein AB1798_09255, partial [Spirochaetota bacterium]